MQPYREAGQPALDSTNARWCCVCQEHTLEVESFTHPSTVGSVSVCCECINKHKKRLANRCNWTVEQVSKHFMFRLTYSPLTPYLCLTHSLLPNGGGYK